MINYSSYNDAWGISPSINNLQTHGKNKTEEHFVNNEFNYEHNNMKKKQKTYNKVNNYINFEDLLNCEDCIKKLKKKLNENNNDNNINSKNMIETFKNKVETFNDKIKNIILIFCKTKKSKDMLLILLILAFIILSFYYVKGRGVETKGRDIEALAEAVSQAEFNMKYLKENFVMIPKNIVNFSPNL